MDVALSKNGGRALRTLFGLVIVFLYAPIAMLLIFSFNDSVLPSFPLSGFTLSWYRQFVTDPDLILADEPTGNLDPATGEGIMRLLDRINKTGTTVVMATHDQRIVNMMRKRVIQLDRGIIVRDQARGVYE